MIRSRRNLTNPSSQQPSSQQRGSQQRGSQKRKQRGLAASRRRRLQYGLETLENRQLLAVVTGTVFEDINGDRAQNLNEPGVADVRVYVDANDNGQFNTDELSVLTDVDGTYLLDTVEVGSAVVRIQAPEGSVQTSPNVYVGVGYVGTDFDLNEPSELFELSTSGEFRSIGVGTSEQLNGIVQTNSGQIFGIGGPQFDSIYTVDPSTGTETLLNTDPILYGGAGLAYDSESDTLFAVASTSPARTESALYVLDPDTGAFIGPRSEAIPVPGLSSLRFDSVNRRVVGFDNATSRFVEFGLDGTARLLSFSNPPALTYALAADGQSVLFFDQPDADQPTSQAQSADPNRGSAVPAFTTSTPLLPTGLHFVEQGDIPARLNVTSDLDILSANFGLKTLPEAVDPANFPPVINELLIDSGFGNDNTDQYVELRGAPNGQLPDNTYLLVVEEDNSQPGEIHGIFDLSSQEFGPNGFLVLLQDNSPYLANPLSNVLQSDSTGFGGLPGNIYTDSQANTDRINPDLGGSGFFLIQTDTPPQLGDDIDSDDDGFADAGGIFDGWQVLDSISLHPGVAIVDQAYGDILIAEAFPGEDPLTRTVPAGTPILVTEGYGYAGRIGDSIGSDLDDWVTGRPTARTGTGADTNQFEIQGDFVFTPDPTAFHSRDLDHVGESNFVGGFRGRITIGPSLADDPANGGSGTGTIQPIVGATVLADTNGNRVQDILTFVVDPDLAIEFTSGVQPDNQFLTNAFDGVTLSSSFSNIDNEPQFNDIRSSSELPGSVVGNRIFSRNILNNFTETQKLRFDFYRPVLEASIVAIGPNISSLASYGRIEAYDIDDNLIAGTTSGPLVGSLRERIAVSSDTENIAYVVAYADIAVAGATNRTRFDRLEYRQSEATDVTDANGEYELKKLFPGSYQVAILEDPSTEGLIGDLANQRQIDRYENFVVNRSFRPNSPPIVDAAIAVDLNENTAPGTEVARVSASDLDGQQISYSLEGGDGLFEIDSNSGVIKITPGAEINFETDPAFELIATVSDSLVESTSTISVTVNDVNEPPTVISGDLFVIERSENGTAVGTIRATDPDEGPNSSVTFQVRGGNGVGVFDVDSQTGVVSVTDSSQVDFAIATQYVLDLRAQDSSVPPMFVDFQQGIRVVDQNDAPQITTQSIDVPEDASGFVGSLDVTDPDLNQTHQFQIVGGTAGNLFDLTGNGELFVKPNIELDFETQTLYTLDVIAVDNGSPPLSAEASITINITDRNEPPTISPTLTSVPENSPTGTVVTTIDVIDPEGSDTVYDVLLLNANDGAEFDYDAATRQLTVSENANLDFEADREKTIRFRVSSPDSSEPTADIVMRVQVTDENDPPRILTSELVVSELAQPGSVVGRLSVQVNEPDLNDEVTGAIVGGNAQSLFDFDSETLVITVAEGASFDAETASQTMTLEIEVTDQAGTTDRRTITILVNDVNEPPTIAVPSIETVTLESGEFYDLVLPPDSIEDPEGRDFQVTVFGEDGQLPDWLEFDRQELSLRGLARPADAGTYDLTLRAFEFGELGLGTELSFTITVEAGDAPLQLKRDPRDVNANGIVTSADALRVINYINRRDNVALNSETQPFNGFVDVSGNGVVTALDALLVINGTGEISGEGESNPLSHQASQRPDDDRFDRAIEELLAESKLF